MKNIIVSAISFVNTEKKGSEIYTTFAKRLINDVLTKTPYDVMVTTNRSDLFDDVSQSERVFIVQNDLESHRTHVGAFNQLLKFTAIKNINPKYDWVLYLDCDAGFIDKVDPTEIDDFIERSDEDFIALRTDATYDDALNKYNQSKEQGTHELFDNKFKFYGENTKWSGAKLPSEHILLIKNNEKLPRMAEEFEKFCTKFETQQEPHIVTFDMESFEIGISAHLSGFNVREMGWANQQSILKVGFNANNWEKIKV
tara:strand:+ start:1296 stop:2060 length:765 start_codon:yes stop_codon:yes gene_type:complete